jgi:hypothetical protein
MAHTSTTVQTLANVGCDLSVDASQYTSAQLQAFVLAVKAKGAHMTLRNCGAVTSTNLQTLAIAGGKNVTLEI